LFLSQHTRIPFLVEFEQDARRNEEYWSPGELFPCSTGFFCILTFPAFLSSSFSASRLLSACFSFLTLLSFLQDDYNASGGKWIVRLQKRLASRYWEDLVLAVLGEQFNVGEEICGIVISIRFQEDIISVWNRSADNDEAKLRIL
jgi:hypothetical protein